MNWSGNTILITGGSSGIGLAFAERFLKRGNTVIVCGRSEEKLSQAKEKFPELHTRVCDVSVESDRVSLLEWVKSSYPEVNILVNNAGIQQRFNLLEQTKDWSYYNQEIKANFEAPIHLTMLFLNHLAEKEKAGILNVTSGLAFTPMAIAPIYCATKAALHSFTISLRHQLSKTNIEVFEIAPPAVNTDLGGPGLHTFGEPLDEFADGIFEGLDSNQQEIGYGRSAKAMKMSREEIDQAVEQMNKQFQ
ncbi:SDR family oxidoreductase [Peribacillus deserti]|uniref:Short-chain dehydrogenase n=1 Tax=Peribacillus deserti TaxID=673318 RepID=A0A2N5M8C1_9BACI|nr:SDR family NAD(P)-dependent oxidoreductase [Peribacillus deserti]PLT30596.1 short-chain dehydrogenase [Peribacillus deserti]